MAMHNADPFHQVASYIATYVRSLIDNYYIAIYFSHSRPVWLFVSAPVREKD